MADRPRVGIVGYPLGQLGVELPEPPGEIVTRIARAADDAGFDFICAQDHVVSPRAWVTEGGARTWFDPTALLAWTAAVTRRVKICTDVLVMPYRSPYATAKIGASLDALSGGRLILGVAAGYLREEFELLGAPFDQRGPWTDDAIQTLKAAWTNEWLPTPAGDVTVSPSPVQRPRPPIWVGGNSMRALRRACEHADGWTPFIGSPERIREALTVARGEYGISDPFAVAVPIRRDVYGDDGLDLGGIERQIESLTQAGATHLRIGFRGPTLEAYLQDLDVFASRFLG